MGSKILLTSSYSAAIRNQLLEQTDCVIWNCVTIRRSVSRNRENKTRACARSNVERPRCKCEIECGEVSTRNERPNKSKQRQRRAGQATAQSSAARQRHRCRLLFAESSQELLLIINSIVG